MVNRPCSLRSVVPSYEPNPIAAIAKTSGVALEDDYKYVHVPEPVRFRFEVIDYFIRIAQHAMVAETTMMFGWQ